MESGEQTTTVRWEVFPNSDRDRGGWWAYVEDGMTYLGGGWRKTRAEAEALAKEIADGKR